MHYTPITVDTIQYSSSRRDVHKFRTKAIITELCDFILIELDADTVSISHDNLALDSK